MEIGRSCFLIIKSVDATWNYTAFNSWWLHFIYVLLGGSFLQVSMSDELPPIPTTFVSFSIFLIHSLVPSCYAMFSKKNFPISFFQSDPYSTRVVALPFFTQLCQV